MSITQHVKKKPTSTAFLLWGPPGAGKSTLIDKYPPETIFKNTDDIVQFNCAPQNQQQYWSCRRDGTTKKIDTYLNHLATTQHKNLAIETTGNWYEPSWSKDLLEQGFSKVEVMCVFVNDVDEIWQRINTREQLSVTHEELMSIYVNSYYTNMEKLLNDPNISNVTIWDNSGERVKLLVSKNGRSNKDVSEKSKVYKEWFQSTMKNIV